MKKLYLFVWILMLYSKLSSQNCSDKSIKTGPANSYSVSIVSPSNTEKPTAINLFTWRLDPVTQGVYYKFNYTNTNTKDILSPWHINDPNSQYYALAKGTNSDYNPADGWEIFKVNMGRLNDDVSQRLIKPLVPYMILYNRYTGKLRVFAYLNRTSDYSTISIQLSIDNVTSSNGLNYSAILSLNNEIAQPLDQKTKIKSTQSASQYPNNQSLFFWVDFNLAYDPCACYYKSNMSVDFFALTQGSLTMTGTITGNVIPVASSSSSPLKM